jgi:geranylgeranyl transferase type-1 subunit beta
MLGDWSFVDTEKAKDYVYRCVGFDGGIGLNPECEAQGGATFCALASLMLMGKLHADAPDSTIEASDATDTKKLIDGCRHWCVQRQVGGYQGRTGKDPDTCYSFWVSYPFLLPTLNMH